MNMRSTAALAHRILIIVLLSVSGTCAMATVATLPQPAPFRECEDRYPDGLIGTWRADHVWTEREAAKSRAHAVDGSARPSEQSLAADNSTITFTADTYAVQMASIGTLERAYRVIGGSTNRYVLELSDESGASIAMTVELVPCGLVLWQRGNCLDAFCENAIRDIFRMLENKFVDVRDGQQFEHMADAAIEAQAQRPVELRRVYYRRVATRTTQTPAFETR